MNITPKSTMDYYNQLITEQALMNMEIYSYDAPHPIQLGVDGLYGLLTTLQSDI